MSLVPPLSSPIDGSKKRRRRFFIGVLIAVSGGLVWGGLAALRMNRGAPSRDDHDADGRVSSLPPPVRPAPVSNAFVGSTACRECHGDLWTSYQSHPMARSLSRVQDFDAVEDYDRQPQFTRGKRIYRVERDGDRVLHHEQQSDGQGEVIYDQAVAVQYALGSGKRGRSYLIDRGGLLFQSPISWYSRTASWDLSPGYAEDVHQRFERRIVDRCISCHAGRVAPDPDWCDRFQKDSPFLELGIGCERCHGPGADHVTYRRTGAPPVGEDPIVNPGRLEPAKRESVCNQCHLHGAELLRYGRTDFDFRPGMHVGEVWSIVFEQDRSPIPESTPAVSQVQQMLESACAMKSAGRLGCISCHDPHRAPAEGEKHAVYREKCLACHTGADCGEDRERRNEPSVNDSCIVCHMPRLTATDVPHTSQTDHRISRRPERSRSGIGPARLRTADEPDVFDLAGAPLSEAERLRVRGYMLAKAADKSHSALLAKRAAQDLEPVIRVTPDDCRAAEGLAFAWSLSNRVDSAVGLRKRLLTISPAREENLLSLSLMLQQRGSPVESLEYLDRLLELNPWRASFWLHRSLLLQRLGRRDEALAASRRALEIDPSLVEAYRRSSDLCGELGWQDAAARFQETIRRLKGL